MAYGFNLGQIEGLDSSVQTVTLTIANASESNTLALKYHLNQGMDSWFDDDQTVFLVITPKTSLLVVPEFTESNVGDTYNVTISASFVEENFKSAVETVLVGNGLINAPETLFHGTITITTEDADGVEIPFDMDVSSYPFEKWTVTINGLEIPYQENVNGFMLDEDNIGYGVFNNDGVYTLSAFDIQDESHPPAPGEYQVKITGVNESGGDVSLYLHNIRTTNYLFNLYTTDSAPYTKNTLAQYLYQNGYNSNNSSMVLSAPPRVTQVVGTSTQVAMAHRAFSTTGSSVSIIGSYITYDTNNAITNISVSKTTTTDNIESDIVSRVI